MLKMNTNGLKNTNRLFDLQRTIRLTAKYAEWLNYACLFKNGSSGCLAQGAFARIVG